MANPKATFTITLVNQTTRAFQTLQKDLGRTGRAFAKFSAAGVAAFGAVAAASANASRSVARIGDVADRLGVATGAYQELNLAATAAGVGQSQFEQGLQRLTRRSADAISGNEMLAQTFEDLGVSTEDLAQMDAAEAFVALAEGLEGVEGRGQQLLRFFRLFDVEGTDLIRVADQINNEAFQGLIDRAREMGAILDDDVIRTAQQTRAELEVFQKVIDANVSEALVNLGPLLTSASEAFLNLAESVTGVLVQFGLLESAGPRAELKLVEEQLEEVRKKQEELIEQDGFWIDRTKVMALRNQLGEEELALLERQVELEKELASLAPDSPEDEGRRVIGEGVPEEEDIGGLGTTQEEGLAEFLTMHQEFSEKLQAQESELQESLTKTQQENWNRRLQSGRQFFFQSLAQGARHNKALFELNKVAQISQALIHARASIPKAYDWGMSVGGPPVAVAFAAAATAAQAANIAALAGTSFGEKGLGGGAGGAAQAPVNTTSAEQVGQGNPGTGGPRQSVQISVSPGVYDANTVRELIDVINEVYDDGAENLSGRFVVRGIG